MSIEVGKGRERVFRLRMSEDEYRTLAALAQSKGVKMAELLRALVDREFQAEFSF